MSKKVKIVFIIVILIPILSPIIYVGVNQAIENSREYYCNNENHTFNEQTKECSYNDEVLPERTYYCEDSKYRLANTTCILSEAKSADYTINADGIDYTCPNGFVLKSNGWCIPLELYNEEYQATVSAKYTETCPDGYNMTQKASGSYYVKSSDDKRFYTDSEIITGYAKKNSYIDICEKEVTYEAKWK